MVALPALIPRTIPVVLTLATAALLLLHVPPLVASANEVVAPVHTLVVPVMVPTEVPVVTDTASVALDAPQVPPVMV